MFTLLGDSLVDTITMKPAPVAAAAASGYMTPMLVGRIVQATGVVPPRGRYITPALMGMAGYYLYDKFVEQGSPNTYNLLIGGAAGIGGNMLRR